MSVGVYDCRQVYSFMNPQGLILDIGCGEGRHTKYLELQGFKVISLDINYQKLKQSELTNSICGDAMTLPFSDEVFDTVLCSEVLEHLPLPDECISEVFRVLRTDGTVCFTTPCLNLPIKSLIPIYRNLMGKSQWCRKEHLHVFSDNQLTKMVRKFFKVENTYYTNYTTIIQKITGHGSILDRALSKMTSNFSPLHYFAAAFFIKAYKLKT